uniref:Leucine rich repeat containing G protein-coupled receptor 5 n=1 Tax=Sphaeramia orbicularis TaxID=375764 RepID=A0A673A603_9TELE
MSPFKICQILSSTGRLKADGGGAGRAGCPERCRCEVDGLLHRVDCSDQGLREIPIQLMPFPPSATCCPFPVNISNTNSVRLAGNDLSFIPRGAFSGLYNLKVLMLQNNQLRSVPDEAFNNLHNLQSLRLDANHISSVPSGCFSGLRSLRHLWLDDNSLTEVPVAALNELPALQAMTLALNHISHVPDHAFSKLGRLVVLYVHKNTNYYLLLDLNYNSLVEFPMAIRSLSHLKELGFHSNNIQSIPEHAFTGNPSLITIFFYDNPIQSVGRSAFQNLPELRTLSNIAFCLFCMFRTITGAQITSLPSSMQKCLQNLLLASNLMNCPVCSDLSSNQLSSLPLMSLQSLTHLRLAGNDELMELIPRENLPRDWEDLLMEFDDEPKPQHSVHCSPAPGPFRPCLHLLGSWLIRGGVWLIASLSLISNCLVALSVFLSPATSVMPPKLLIGLLALVNGLMGVWSGWLAAVDAWTFGSFWRYGAAWESSFLCRLSGFLCVFASQTGLFLLTVAALERCGSSLALFVRLAIFLCFLLGLAITLPPLVTGHSSTSLCLLLPSSSSSSSVAFSVFLVLLDSLCFLIMTFAYTRLYCRANKTPPTSEEDAALTRHVAWLLFSDCLLYLPVAFLSFSSLLHLPAAGPDAAKAVLLLVAPLPACINPLLYLLFNPHAREDVSRGRRPGSRSRLDPLDLVYDEDAEKQSCDSTQALVAVGGTKEDEEEGRGTSETQHSVAFVVPRH